MLDMTLYVDEQEHYITDLKVNEKGMMEITFADGNMREEPYTEHNYNFYRNKMVEQAEKYTEGAINDLGCSYLKTQILRFGSAIGGLVGLYLLYNFDIHIIMKIIITALIALGEAAMYFFTQIYMIMLENDSIQAFAYEEYVKHLDNFRYFDMEKGVDHYILPIEDIEKHKMDSTFVKNINENIEKMLEMGSNIKDIRINYSEMEDTKKKK